MSFLNPVNEPVLRFSSTDADAPQINYAARTAGDVKSVLKACLVTGYGSTASAGWTAVNEVGNVIEFVSPSAAMSDYRLGIDDSTATKTDWYCRYQDARVNPSYNTPPKVLSFADRTSGENGWQLLVTERGIIFIESVLHSAVAKLSARITYWGQVKSALVDETGENICFFNIGHGAAISQPNYFYAASGYVYTKIGGYTGSLMSAATSYMLYSPAYTLGTANVDLVSPIYLADSSRSQIIGELSPMLSKIVNVAADVYGITESVIGARDVLILSAGHAINIADTANSYARTFLIRTDYWEY